MQDSEQVIYTPVELESYIPAGWTLASGDEGTWDPDDRIYSFHVLDGSDLEWEVSVEGSEIEEHGRIEALQRAVDRLERERFQGFLG